MPRQSFVLDDGVLIQIDAMGDCARTFHLEFFGTQRTGTFDITDNFSMFRRMLWEFSDSIRTGSPPSPLNALSKSCAC